MTEQSNELVVGYASRQGSREFNCDAIYYHVFRTTGTLGLAVVDGIGNSRDIAESSSHIAWIMARVSARLGPMQGILAACTPLAAPRGSDEPDAVTVVAMKELGKLPTFAWTGDCRASGYNGTELTQYTEDHTAGQRLRAEGASESEAARRDNSVTTSVARANVNTVPLVEAGDDDFLWVLTTDGVHKTLSAETICDLVAVHVDDVQACAEALVDAALTARAGADYVDDASAAVFRVT